MNRSPKGAIIYSSRYGATRQYAEWLAEDLTLYETLIIGSSLLEQVAEPIEAH